MRSVDRNLPDPFEFSLAHQNPCGIEVFAQWRTENRSLRLCFVDLRMTVRNSSHQGPSFVPQNKVKIVIDDNSFDGKNLDAGSDYVGNIEPTLSRQRECYFELPRALVKDSFLLRFGGNFTDTSMFRFLLRRHSRRCLRL